MSKIIIIICVYIFNFVLVKTADVKLNLKVDANTLDVQCEYTLAAKEKFTSVSIRKDSQIFFEYSNGQESSQTFTNISGITFVKMGKGCQITIMNFQDPESMGEYQVVVKYITAKGSPSSAKKRYRTKLHSKACKYSWVNATVGDNLPPGAFAAAINADQTPLHVCRGNNNENSGYVDAGSGCVYTYGGPHSLKNYQVLTGTGLHWVTQNGHKNRPANALLIGKDPTGNMYMGRCNYMGSAFIGKVTDGFYFNYQGKETKDCEIHDILVC